MTRSDNKAERRNRAGAHTGGSDAFGGGGVSAASATVSAICAQSCTGSVTAGQAVQLDTRPFGPFGSCRVSLAEENGSFYSFTAQATDAAGNSLLAEMDFVQLPQAGTFSSADSMPYTKLLVTWQQSSTAATYQAKTTPSASNGSIMLDLTTVNNFKLAQSTGYYTISGELTATVPDEAMSQSITLSISF